MCIYNNNNQAFECQASLGRLEMKLTRAEKQRQKQMWERRGRMNGIYKQKKGGKAIKSKTQKGE
jgi:hypothetical protein